MAIWDGAGVRGLTTLWRKRALLGGLLRVELWIVLLAAIASAVLAGPDQVIELYRIAYADGSAAEPVRLVLSIVLMAASIWCGATVVAAMALGRGPSEQADRGYALALPYLLAALPFLGCGIGHLNGRPAALQGDELAALSRVGSPWGTVADALRANLQGQLTLFGALYLVGAGAVCLLGLIFAKGKVPEFARRIAARDNALTVLPVVVTVILLTDGLFILSPVTVPRLVGPFGIAALFVTAISLNASLLTLLSHRWRVPLIPALLGLAVLFSALNLNDDHLIRTLPSASEAHRELRPSFATWFARRPDLAGFQAEYPVYVVAAQGGGIYASYQAAVVLARLQDRCPHFRDHLFAISGVSGGSIGAAAFVAALRSEASRSADPEQGRWCSDLFDSHQRTGPLERQVDKALTDDHLSPLVAAALFPDFTQRFLPLSVARLDRARSLETSFEKSVSESSGGRADLAASLGGSWSPSGSLPALVLNATDAGTGMRYVFAPFDLTPPPDGGWTGRSLDSYPLWRTSRDVRLSTAAVTSARFPWITPAALLPEVANEAGNGLRAGSRGARAARTTRLVDGGYVDNSGVETALDIIGQLDGTRPMQMPGVSASALPRARFVLIAVTTSAVPVRTSLALGETLEPMRALLSTRSARAYLALGRAYRQLRSVKIQNPFPGEPAVQLLGVRPIPLSNEFYRLPLGWRLSRQTADIITLQSGRGWECQPDLAMTQRAEKLSAADCVHRSIAADLRATVPEALRQAAVENYGLVTDGRAPAPRFDHEAVLRCLERRRGRSLSNRQASGGRAMLDEWDRRIDLTDSRWLAFMLAVMDYNTGDMTPLTQDWTRERLIAHYGPATPLGRLLGNRTEQDAIDFRGRGFLYLTGRDNYEAVARGTGVDVVSYPDLMGNRALSAQAMFWFIMSHKARALEPPIERPQPDWTSAWRVINARETRGADERVRTVVDCLAASSPGGRMRRETPDGLAASQSLR